MIYGRTLSDTAQKYDTVFIKIKFDLVLNYLNLKTVRQILLHIPSNELLYFVIGSWYR